MISKNQIINALEQLPENVTIDELIDQLIFIEKVEKGIDDSLNGRVNDNVEAAKKLKKWLR